jgi:hypothetical protein
MIKILKLLVLLILIFGVEQTVLAQGATYYSNASGEALDLENWDDVGDGTGANPPSFEEGDLFIITDGFHMTVSTGTWVVNAPDGICGIQIEINASLTVAATRNISIPGDGSFILNGDYIHNSALVMDRDIFDNPSIAAGSTITLGANQTWNALYPNLVFANLILNTGVTATCQRQINIDGNLTINGSALLTITANVNLVNVSGFTNQYGTGTVRTVGTSGAALPSNVTWEGTVHLNAGATAAQTLPAGTYNNVITRTTSSGSNTLSGTISIAGTFTANSGNYVTTGSTINYNGSAAQNIPVPITAYNNLTISNAGTKTMNGNIQVNGTLIVSNAAGILAINGNTLTLQSATSMTGSLAGSSTSNLTVGGTAGGNATLRFNAAATDSLLNNLTLNRTGASAGITLGSNVAITNLLSITNGTFIVNSRIVTLKSTSIANTAQLAEVTGTLDFSSGGSFTTERFIPQGNRAYRDFGPGVNTASGVNFFETWQESASSTPNRGIHITGLSGVSPGGNDATTGMDLTTTGARSLFTYVNGVWSSGVSNTKTTKPEVYQGYRAFVRGDRTVNLYTSQSSMNAATVIRANGTPISGTVTYTTSGITNSVLSSSYSLNINNTANDYSLIANPYLCAIDWSLVSRTNISASYTVFDPTIGTNGAYVTCNTAGVNSNGASDVDQYIQSGQAFFVQTTAPSPQLVISESNKNTANKTNVFRTANTPINKLSFGLLRQISGVGLRNVDGCVAVFNENETNDIDDADARKLSNTTENISILKNATNLSIETKALPNDSDTMYLRLWQLANNASYTFSVNTRNFSTNKLAYLVDAVTNTERLLKSNDTTNVTFTALTANAAVNANRFKIVFRNNAALPLSTINLQAVAKNNGIDVNWQTTNEIELKSYEVERSIDAANFIQQASVVAKNESNNSYNYFDANIKSGLWYYRIKIINKDGSSKYTNTIAINLNAKGADLIVYPNPVKGKTFTVQLATIEKGNYSIQLFNQSGQLMLQKSTLLQASSNASIVVDFKQQQLPIGNYSIVLTNESGMKLVKQIMIAE